MFYVYILKSKHGSNLYIGFAINLQERFLKHNQGLVKSTKRYMPWALIYYEAYRDKKDALIREKRLKRFAKGFALLKKRLTYSLMF